MHFYCFELNYQLNISRNYKKDNSAHMNTNTTPHTCTHTKSYELLSYSMWCHVVWYIGTNVSKELAASIWRAEDEKSRQQVTPKCWLPAYHITWYYIPNDSNLHSHHHQYFKSHNTHLLYSKSYLHKLHKDPINECINFQILKY